MAILSTEKSILVFIGSRVRSTTEIVDHVSEGKSGRVSGIKLAIDRLYRQGWLDKDDNTSPHTFTIHEDFASVPFEKLETSND